MKVILKEDVKKLGNKDDLLEVNDGYARNYLIPKGLAVEANPKNMNIIKSKKMAEENRVKNEKAAAVALSGEIKTIRLEIKAKGGENGRLFGSVTSMDIVQNLKNNYNINIDKKKIHLPEPIKTTGEHEVDIKLYPGVAQKLKVVISIGDI